MNAKVYDTLIEALQELQAEGYTENFELQKDGLCNVDSDEQIAPDNFEVKSTHRFEGMSNPADSSILYAIETNDGKKGTFVENYTFAATDLTKEMREKLKFKIGANTVRPEDI